MIEQEKRKEFKQGGSVLANSPIGQKEGGIKGVTRNPTLPLPSNSITASPHQSPAPSNTRSFPPIPTMNDFDGLFTSDFGLKPQGKSAPMAPQPKGSSNSASLNFDFGSRSARASSNFDDLLAGAGSDNRRSDSPFDLDSMYGGPPARSTNSPPPPVYDKPVYDDDIFDGVPGLKSTSKVKFDDVFATTTESGRGAAFDDLLGGFGKESKSSDGKRSEKDEKGVSDFDDLLAGFGHSRSSSGGRYIYVCVCAFW